MTDENIKTAIKNMNTYLDECHDDDDAVTITAKVLRSIRDNYCELLRCKKAIERLEGYNQNLLAANVGLSCGMLDEIKAAKSEAVKECAERVERNLIERVSEKIRERNPHWYLAIRVVRETKMEMEGDE